MYDCLTTAPQPVSVAGLIPINVMSDNLNTAPQTKKALELLIPLSVMSDVLTISPQGQVAVARLILL